MKRIFVCAVFLIVFVCFVVPAFGEDVITDPRPDSVPPLSAGDYLFGFALLSPILILAGLGIYDWRHWLNGDDPKEMILRNLA